ncbi:MAG: hypothetical protein EOP40_06035 [Rubrivivax sp.]|nr:MAG: hypothetical protein EOP40_06035 [Rubrivivax sp.]
MSDKYLSDAEWKKFAKGRELKDAPLLKALISFQKADKASPKEQLKLLDEIEDEGATLLKQHKADKEIASRLSDMGKAITLERKATTARADQAEEEADDDAPTPALLSSKLIPLLRMVAKDKPMKALIAVTGKDAAVMLAPRAMSPSMRKVLASALGDAGGIKYLTGDCVFEDKTHTFVLKTQPGGLAKKLKQAILDQTGLRLNVQVRGEGPTDAGE